MMVATLTFAERRIALALSVALALLGLAIAASARHGVMAVHGWMALGLGLSVAVVVGRVLTDGPEPGLDRLSRYCDEPTRFGIVMTLVWALIGMSVGVWVAALMYWPATVFRRVRQVGSRGGWRALR